MSVQIKRGDTFLVEGVVTTDGVAQDLTGWSVRCHVRRGSTLVQDLEVQWTNRAAGVYRLHCADTTAWPVGVLTSDIEYTTQSGQIASTETFEIEVIKDETR